MKKIIHIILFIFLVAFSGLSFGSSEKFISFHSGEPEFFQNKPLLKSNPKVYPNPFASEFTLLIQATESEKVKLQLHNVIGKHIWSGEETLEAGTNRFTYTFDNIENGIYYLSVINGENKKTQKIVKK